MHWVKSFTGIFGATRWGILNENQKIQVLACGDEFSTCFSHLEDFNQNESNLMRVSEKPTGPLFLRDLFENVRMNYFVLPVTSPKV